MITLMKQTADIIVESLLVLSIMTSFILAAYVMISLGGI